MLKRTGGGIASVIGFVTAVVAFINLAVGNKGIVPIILLVVGIGTIEVALLWPILRGLKNYGTFTLKTRTSEICRACIAA